MSQSYRIMSLEAKDIFAAMQIPNNKEGYKIRDEKGEFRLRRFINTLDDSLDTRQLKDTYEKVTRRNNFSFKVGKHEYCPHIINVKFSFSYKEWNLAGFNTYVKSGHNIQELEIVDGVCLHNDELVAIQTNVEIKNPIPQKALGEYFVFCDGHYEQVGNIPTLLNKAELREYLYKNGFLCDGQYMVRYKRSTGSGRLGKCLFTNSVVSDRMEKWDKCGLKIDYGDPVDLAAYESYISLSMSSIIDTIKIQPNEILVIDDYISEFEDEVIAVSAPNDKLIAEKKKVKIKNDIWDGQSLADISLFEKYPNKAMLVLRARFFKTAAFSTNIQNWFKDNNIYSVDQLNGFTLATDISQIKLITTPNSIKYIKFGTLKGWLNNVGSEYGVVKTEQPTKFFGGRMVALHYQLLNSLQLSKEEVETLLEPSIEHLRLVRSDPDMLRYHVGLTLGSPREDLKARSLTTRNSIVFKMLGVNNRFSNTKYYKEFRGNLLKSMVNNIKRGRVLVPGNYSVLFGNCVEMLKSAIGLFDGNPEFEPDTVYCKNFQDGEKLLGSRSPHIVAGNIWLIKNKQCPFIDKYFNLTNEIVCVNAINENIQHRLNGSDYDSDTVLLSNHPQLISVAERNYEQFYVPTGFIDAKKTNRVYSPSDKVDLDIKTSENLIGQIVNLSQLLNSLYWQRLHNGETFESLEELYLDNCKLAILSSVEIDRAKKEIAIDSKKEISMISEKYEVISNGKRVKPTFFKSITLDNGYALNENIKYKDFDTTMDYLQNTINKANIAQSRIYKSKTLPFTSILKKPLTPFTDSSAYYRKNKAIELVKEAQMDISQIRALYSKKDRTKRKERRRLLLKMSNRTEQCVREIARYDWCEHSLYLALREIDKKENASISTLLFDTFFQLPNEKFFSLIKQSADVMFDVVECDDGDIKLYGFTYKKEESVPKIA